MTTNGASTTTTLPKDRSTSTNNSTPDRKQLCLAGVGVSHSIAYAMHNHIAYRLSLSWIFTNAECPTIASLLSLLHGSTFAGAVITMPYKQTIMPHLDALDPLAVTLGAVNCVYHGASGELRGTNTDWRGVAGCLLSVSEEGREKPALIIGAGGASRAAVYALFAALGCKTIYIINHDMGEVEALFRDAQAYAQDGHAGPQLVHVRSVAQARRLPPPFYVVGTVPDVEPQTDEEKEARAVLEEFLARHEEDASLRNPGRERNSERERDKREKGVLLDMCFKLRVTRHIKLARRHGWRTVEGTLVIGHHIGEQWRLWVGEEAGRRVPREEAWAVLRGAAEESKVINF